MPGAAGTGRRVGRPTEAVLSVGLIAETALKVIDASRTGDFTMTELADALGVKASAIYNHVGGRVEVLERVRELVSDRIDTSAFGRMPWGDAVANWARSYRSAFAMHPVTVALFATTRVGGASRTLAMYERVTAAFVDAGWPQSEVLSVIVALEDYILGAALDVVAPDDMLDPKGSPDAPQLVAAYAAQTPAHGGSRADASFELGLAALISGLSARRDALASAARDQP